MNRGRRVSPPDSGPRQNVKSSAMTTGVYAELRPYNGAAAVFAGGKPLPPVVIELLPDASQEQIRCLAEIGNHLYFLRGADLGWKSKGVFDETALETRLRHLLEADPAAKYLLEVNVDAPVWWLEEHPDERVVCADSQESSSADSPVSWASHRWLDEAGNGLMRLVKRIYANDAGRNCLGWQISAGKDGEWRSACSDGLPDIGPRMTATFRTFALSKYRRNEGLLRKAWFDSRAEFDTLSCPSAADRNRADYGVFRNPTRSRRLLDYYEAYFQAQNAAALRFCSLVKRASEGKALVGLSYAPMFENGARPEAGQGYPEPVLDSPDVDFFANRGPAVGHYLRALPGSLALRGKLLFHIPAVGQSPQQAAALAQTHQAGIILPASTSLDGLRSILAAADRALHAPAKLRKRASPVAVLMDPTGNQYVHFSALEKDSGTADLLSRQMQELTHLGASVDVYLLSDLFHPKFPDYKIFLFLNAFYLSEAERRRVDARIKRSEQTAIWLWGEGLIGETGLNGELGQRFCGQKLRVEGDGTSLRVRIVEANDPLTWGQHIGASFGLETPAAPTITITDKLTARLGANSANKTVFAARRYETWTSIVFGTPLVPAYLLRNVLRASGCHLYIDATQRDAAVAVDARSVGVFTRRGGAVKISLPGLHDVTNAWTGQPMNSSVREFDVTLPPESFGFYELRPRLDPAKDTNKSR